MLTYATLTQTLKGIDFGNLGNEWYLSDPNRFDVAGDGACLKRYTDPSFFKVEPASSIATVEMQREKKIRKVKVLQWNVHCLIKNLYFVAMVRIVHIHAH